MTSLIPGYEYDIFISYRQKDNKHDGWVDEFVKNLRGELESTFKEEISVYFDINLHDGLLETHDVDASLQGKLKCLIFIPIVSRTYCDPKSFAWDHEFKSFIEHASRDQFGLKVKLPNGNIAGRVLPIRIYDLDPEDIKLFESVVGGIFRGIEFIYKSPGVNRPLRSNEDHPHDNLNKTYYRDQINKVANAINEILQGLKRLQSKTSGGEIIEENPLPGIRHPLLESSPTLVPKGEKSNSNRLNFNKGFQNRKNWRIASISSIGVILTLISFFLFSSGSILPFSNRDWILITDFENLTDNPVFDKSLYTAFSLTTSQSSYVNILSRSRMFETLSRMEMKDLTTIDDKTGREIAMREGITIYIVPSISSVGNRYSIAAKLVETKTGNLLRSVVLNAENQDEILSTLDQLSKDIRRQLGESRYKISTQDRPLSKVTTSSLEALKVYSIGIEHHLLLDFAGAKDCYESALRIDTGFIAAKASLGNILIEKFDSIEKGRELMNQAVKSVDGLTERERLGILSFYAKSIENDIPKAIRYSKIRIDLYPDDPVAHNNLGWYYHSSGQFEDALNEYKAAVRIDRNMALSFSGILWIYLEKFGKPDSALVWAEKMISANPQNIWGYINLGSAWLCLDSLNKAESAFTKATEINPKFILNMYRLAHVYRLQGRYDEAIGILSRIPEIDRSEASAYYDLGVNYQLSGNQKEALKYFSKFKKIVTEEWMKKWPDDAKTYTAISAAMARLGDMKASYEMLQKAISIDSAQHESFAEVYCLQGNAPETLMQLEKAFNTGYRDLFWLKLNPDLTPLKYDIRYQNLLNKYFK
jgi:tetratricopeptide (TPR) repeat protein